MSFRHSRFFDFGKSNGDTPQSPDAESPQTSRSSTLKEDSLLSPSTCERPTSSQSTASGLRVPSNLSIRSKRNSFFQAFSSSAASSSSDGTDRPASIASAGNEEGPKQSKKLSKKNPRDAAGDQGPLAWVAGHREKVPYELDEIVNGGVVPELWDTHGDCLVYLFPKEDDKPASFKIKSKILTSSRVLNSLAELADARDSFDHEPNARHLYIPLDQVTISSSGLPSSSNLPDTVEARVAVRNLFAFLMGRSLVSTLRFPSVFDIFLKISELLKLYEFSNVDGSSFGDNVSTTFDAYSDEFGLADVRTSIEKTIQGIVLGERMRSVKLYNEAFTHAVGKHEAVEKAADPAYKMISPITINRLGRAALNLNKHIDIVQQTLEGLEFHAIFSGIMSSKHERKHVDLDRWKTSFFATRKFYINFYKNRYKKWPPRTMKNGGLSRLVMQSIYEDLCSVYDLLVDRTNLTTMGTDGALSNDQDDSDPKARLLRQIFSEYNRSSPPVKPAIPFDMPIIPSLKSIRPDFDTGHEKKDDKAMLKKLKDEEIEKVFPASHNSDVTAPEFAEAFKDLERKMAHSRNMKEIVDHRMGQWIFIYAVLQVLPLLVVDGPGLEHTKDVEYFLCEPPRSGLPWMREVAARNGSPSSGVSGMVSLTAVNLPADLVGSGIEAIYYRSHCWTVAEKWHSQNSAAAILVQMDHVETPQSTGASDEAQRDSESGAATSSKPAPFLSLPTLVVPTARPRTQAPRPVSVYDPSKTFDTILTAPVPEVPKK